MATLEEMAARLWKANPNNEPMYLTMIAKTLWPDATWLNKRQHNHNGGARTGASVAGAFAGRMERKGLLRRHITDGPRAYVLVLPNRGYGTEGARG